MRADAVAEPGSYGLKVSFRGAAASTTQHYTVVVHADETAMRAASTSYLRRITGYNPFVLAAGCCGLALLGGVVVFRLGSKYIRQLTTLGCGEIVRVEQNADTAAQAQSRPHLVPAVWSARARQRERPAPFMMRKACPLTARAQEAKNGTLELNFDSITSPAAEAGAPNTAVRPGCLVQLAAPKAALSSGHRQIRSFVSAGMHLARHLCMPLFFARRFHPALPLLPPALP